MVPQFRTSLDFMQYVQQVTCHQITGAQRGEIDPHAATPAALGELYKKLASGEAFDFLYPKERELILEYILFCLWLLFPETQEAERLRGVLRGESAVEEGDLDDGLFAGLYIECRI